MTKNLKRKNNNSKYVLRNSVTKHSRYCKKQKIKNLYFDKSKHSYIFKKFAKSNKYLMSRHMSLVKNNFDFDEMVVDWLDFLKSHNADDGSYEKEYNKVLDLVNKWEQENNFQSEINFTLGSDKKIPKKISIAQTLKIPGWVCLNCDKYITPSSVETHMNLLHSIIEIPQKSLYN